MMNDTPKPRVLVLGLDGATFDVIRPLVEQGRLPTLGRLMRTGSHGNLTSTQPPITPTAWTSFSTGTNPATHGIFDFQRIDPSTYAFEPVPAHQHAQRTVWRILSDAGRTSVVLDVPFTYPPQPIRGSLVTGYGTPTAPRTVFTYPSELRDELIAHCGRCEVATSATKYNLTPSYFAFWDELLESRARIAPYLMERDDWDFFMVVFGVTDNMQHNLWVFLEPQHPAYHSSAGRGFRERLFSYYERVDELCGMLIDKAGPSTHVLVMSDHGFGSTRTNKYLSKALLEAGLVHYKGLRGVGALSGRLMRGLLEVYHRTPFLADIVRRLSGRQKEGLKRALARTSLLPTAENIDWDRTVAFPGGYGLQVFVNCKDRFAHGTVQPGEEYEQVVGRIMKHLLAVKDPVTGERVYAAVHRARDIYHGAFAEQAPDLLVEYANAHRVGQADRPRVLNPGLEGNHTLHGIFIAHGPSIRPRPPDNAQITDLAPTILYLLGLPVPRDMDGRVMTEILDPVRVAAQPVTYDASAAAAQAADYHFSEEEAKLVRDQLRALGYIE
jgi:predicted AlkP superfamily phosphohydrolase/phosphomutase